MWYFLVGYLALSLLAVVVVVCACIASGRTSRYEEKWLDPSPYKYEEPIVGLRSSLQAGVQPRPQSVPAIKPSESSSAVATETRQPPRILPA